MDINIRKAVIDNLKGTDNTNVRNTIVDAIHLKEEKTLPGLGVLFEVLWQNSSSDEQNTFVNTIAQSLK